MRWVGQKHARGCGVAALAMLAGLDYDAVAATWPGWDFDKQGLYLRGMQDWLVDHGFMYAPKLRYMGWFRAPDGGQVERSPWPPEPFGDVHLCEVQVAESSPVYHFVVTTRDGTVLDPLTPEPKRLSDYHQVLNVAAVCMRPG